MANNPGGGTPFIYNRETMIDNMSRLITLDEHPFSYVESLNLEEFSRLSLQPAYRRVPRNIIKRRIISQYYQARGELIEFFSYM